MHVGYSVYAPGWFDPTLPLLGHHHAAPHGEMMHSALHAHAAKIQAQAARAAAAAVDAQRHTTSIRPQDDTEGAAAVAPAPKSLPPKRVVDEAQQDAGGAAEDGWMFDSDEDGMEIDVVSSEEESEDQEGDEEDL